MAIISLLVSFSIPAIHSMAKARTVTTAGYRVKDFLDYARTFAMSRGKPVRVGFENVRTDGFAMYGIYLGGDPSQIASPSDTTAWKPIAQPQFFDRMQIDFTDPTPSSSFSTAGSALNDVSNNIASFSRTVGGLSSDVIFPNNLVITPTGEFSIVQGGSGSDTTFYPTRNIYFGLLPADGSGNDWAVVSINGAAGRVSLFRPEDF